MGDRRFGMRVPRADAVEIRWQDQAGEAQQSAATLSDISPTGASLQTPRPLRMGVPLTLVFNNVDYPSTVKHCSKRGSIFLVGIEFRPGHRWLPYAQ